MPKQDPFSILKEDHARLKKLLDELVATTERAVSRRTELVGAVKRLLGVHAALEEEIFYPAFQESSRAKQDQKKYYEALEEHRAVRLVLADLERADPATPHFGGKAKVLRKLVLDHAREEEREMFATARQHLFKEEVIGLAIRMTARRSELETLADVLPMMSPDDEGIESARAQEVSQTRLVASG